MTDRDGDDDGAYEDVVRRAGRATRVGWTAIAGVLGALGCALMALVVICAAALVAYLSGVAYVDR
ncbi:hypothetical protein AB0H29_04995 [Streptomyces thermolilacinus]